ncbi:hypothetical protein diail_12049 [Diaporthe ilicicola]|nr:hypothetical protein diail_12049 [Diaporthe ilicicola]
MELMGFDAALADLNNDTSEALAPAPTLPAAQHPPEEACTTVLASTPSAGPRSPSAKSERRPDLTQDPGWLTPLHMAAQNGHLKIVQLLVQHNPDCNCKDSDGMTPLMLAVSAGHEEVAGVLLSSGARVPETDVRGRSSLHLAVEDGREAMLRLLLDRCQGLNAAVNAYDGSGRTPLHIAVAVGFETAVEMLLRFGANVGLKAPKRPK